MTTTVSYIVGSIGTAARSERAARRAVRQRVPAVVRDAARTKGLTVRIRRRRRRGPGDGPARRRAAGTRRPGAGRAAAAGLRVPRAAQRRAEGDCGLANHHHPPLARGPHGHPAARPQAHIVPLEHLSLSRYLLI